jgi:flagellar biosynthesis/type III secretory pathway protein FliH
VSIGAVYGKERCAHLPDRLSNKRRKEGRNDGMKEGRNDGMKEGRNDGMMEGRKEGRKE